MSGNRIKLVTAIKLQPQNLEQNFWPKRNLTDRNDRPKNDIVIESVTVLPRE